jgi:hypothetical protein
MIIGIDFRLLSYGHSTKNVLSVFTSFIPAKTATKTAATPRARIELTELISFSFLLIQNSHTVAPRRMTNAQAAMTSSSLGMIARFYTEFVLALPLIRPSHRSFSRGRLLWHLLRDDVKRVTASLERNNSLRRRLARSCSRRADFSSTGRNAAKRAQKFCSVVTALDLIKSRPRRSNEQRKQSGCRHLSRKWKICPLPR